MPFYRQLLTQARRLARLDPLRPSQANLRRAVSAAYYSLYHCLIEHACVNLVGASQDRRAFRHVLARGFEHGVMRRACRSFGGGILPTAASRGLPPAFAVPPDLQEVAQTFVESQELRHRADYDLSETFTRAGVLAHVADVDDAIQRLHAIRALPEAKFFLACLGVWGVLDRRR